MCTDCNQKCQSPCTTGERLAHHVCLHALLTCVQERGDLLNADKKEMGDLFEKRSRMEADFMERFLAAVESYQGVLEALRIADAEDYHILKIRCVWTTTEQLVMSVESYEPHDIMLSRTQVAECLLLHDTGLPANTHHQVLPWITC